MSTAQHWLDQVKEAALDPELPIIDPHHHLWDHSENPYLLPDLLADTNSGHNIVATVFVECASMYRADGDVSLRPVGETEFVNGIAAMSASGGYGPTRAAAGIVGFADLLLGAEAGRVLDVHMARSERFRGIRHAGAWDASPDVRNSHTQPFQHMFEDAQFRRGFAELKPRELSFEAWVYHPQIPEVTALARAFPDTTIILDHFGGPIGIGPYAGKREAIFTQWREDIAELARCPNVVAKLGGITMPVNGFGFHRQPVPPDSDALVQAIAPYVLHTIECFGAARCMFESNFPVDKRSCSYTVLWNAFKKLAAGAGAAEKRDLFHDTAARVYRL